MSEAKRHPDSTVLLAMLDGEIGRIRAWHVRRHINRCWTCRGRAVELQHTIADVGRTLNTPAGDIDGIAIARARWNFRQSVVEFEANSRARCARFRLVGAAGAAFAVLAAVLVAFWQSAPRPAAVPRAETGVAAAELLAAMQAQELAPIPAVHEESFTIQVNSSRSQGPMNRELRILTAPKAGLHSARWLDNHGVLRNAVFADDSDRAEDAVYSMARGLRPAILRRPSRYTALYQTVAASEATIESLETAILDWIGNQVWEPVSLAREAVEFSSRSGAILHVRREAGHWIWTAEAPVGAASVRLLLRSIEGHPVTLMEISWESGADRGFVRLRREWRRVYPTLSAAPVWLRASSLSHLRDDRAIRPLPPPPLVSNRPALQDLLGAEIEAIAALHRAGLCQRDGIRVTGGDTSVHVSGTFIDEAEGRRMQAVLLSLPRARLLDVAIQILDRSASAVHMAPYVHHPEQPSRAAAGEAWLRTRMGVGTRSSERDMFSRMSLLIRSSEDVLANAWALEHLAAQFPAARQALLAPADRETLITVMTDHLRSAANRLEDIDSLLAFAPRSNPKLPLSGVHWQDQAHQFREISQRFCQAMLDLFTSSDSTSVAAVNPEASELPDLLGQLRARSPLLAESAASPKMASQ